MTKRGKRKKKAPAVPDAPAPAPAPAESDNLTRDELRCRMVASMSLEQRRTFLASFSPQEQAILHQTVPGFEDVSEPPSDHLPHRSAAMPEPVVVIRADANWNLGGGHVTRCLSLANGLWSQGWRCVFVGCDETEITVPALGASEHDFLALPHSESNEIDWLRRCWPEGVALLIVDHYGLDAQFESGCQPWAERVLVIDDLANRPHACDMLLDQTLGRDPAAYQSLVPPSCRLLLGPEYALLRQTFTEVRSDALHNRRTSEGVSRIQVSLGATDPDNITSTVLRGIAASGHLAQVDVLLSAASPNIQAVEAMAAEMGQQVTVHSWISNMAMLLAETDLVIGAGGSSSWERCLLGVPALVITTADNQHLVAEELDKAGAVQWLGHGSAVEAAQVASALNQIAGDRELWRRMSDAASQICQGHGVEQVVGAILSDQSGSTSK